MQRLHTQRLSRLPTRLAHFLSLLLSPLTKSPCLLLLRLSPSSRRTPSQSLPTRSASPWKNERQARVPRVTLSAPNMLTSSAILPSLFILLAFPERFLERAATLDGELAGSSNANSWPLLQSTTTMKTRT